MIDMQNFLYRFRPISRLLGDEARPGELENTEIYFAPPDQLNDPLEGYLEIFWSGDIIVWKNLFKHYLFCLTHRALDLYIFGEKPTLNKTVTIPDSLSGANEEGRKLLDSVYELFFSNHLMAEYIECLTTRQIYRDELSAHLFSLHQNMLYCVYRAFEANNMPWPGLSFLTNFEKDRESFFKNTAIPFLKDRAKQAHRVEDDVFTRTVFNTNQMWLQKQYQAAENKKKVSGNMDFLLVGFPSAFLQALETLTYPNWYTACFMTNCENSSIWGSYGDNHKGVCLKFRVETSNKTFKIKLLAPVGTGSEGIIKQQKNIEFRKVIYNAEHLPINFFQSLGNASTSSLEKFWYRDELGNISNSIDWLQNMNEQTRDAHWKSFYDATSSKLKVWEHENEYRLILHPSSYNLQNASDRTLKYNFKSLEGIIFGVKTSDSDKIAIMQKIKKLCDVHSRSTFKFFQARYDQVHKTINYYELNEIKL